MTVEKQAENKLNYVSSELSFLAGLLGQYSEDRNEKESAMIIHVLNARSEVIKALEILWTPKT